MNKKDSRDDNFYLTHMNYSNRFIQIYIVISKERYMAAKDKQKNDDESRYQELEDAYLKRFESAISGPTSRGFYQLNEREKKRQEQIRKIRGEAVSTPVSPPLDSDQPDKEPPRIPIEWAIQDANGSTASPSAIPPSSQAHRTRQPAPAEPPQRQDVPAPESRSETVSPQTGSRARVPSLHEIGAILRLEDGSIGIYKGPMPGKEYHFIYHLLPDGNVRPEGVYITSYNVEHLGQLAPEVLDELQKNMHWERDRIIYHLSSYEKARLIPILDMNGKPKTESQAATPTQKKEGLERGRRIVVKIGDKIWEAVYWGRDELGQIVAHNTHKSWTLMHLNLGRFGDSMDLGEKLSPEEIRHINECLSESIHDA